MFALLFLQGGRQVDALLLSASPDRLRVVVPGRGDVMEYRLVENHWQSESGARVEIGAMMSPDGASPSLFQSSSSGASRRYFAMGFSGSTCCGQV
jgi:hypothetical protein